MMVKIIITGVPDRFRGCRRAIGKSICPSFAYNKSTKNNATITSCLHLVKQKNIYEHEVSVACKEQLVDIESRTSLYPTPKVFQMLEVFKIKTSPPPFFE